MNAIVTSMIANLHAKPDESSELVDEVLYGMSVKIIEDIDENWARIQTACRYEGYCQKANLIVDKTKTDTWRQEANHFINQSFADVLQQPRIQSAKMITLVKGSIICSITIDGLDPEWAVVQLVSGETGYVRRQWLQEKIPENSLSEQQIRENVVQTALSYLTAPYRWGGKSPLGIDCSGLCSMAYMLNGVYIYRDAKIVEGFPIKEISLGNIQKGDLIYFPGHMALYIGELLYVHSSLGGNEVNINSLDEQHQHYRSDLANSITAIGSLFK
ncbi:peptidase [Lysinibacillus sp. KCTC 33748]|uniref:SH3 domain-containing C40 family peptidase n=1 Tax=unclassified Lysinibacillus TaxID=2636778 RepID=UPI0009A5C544|nr:MULTISPECIES: SH3 domain-containing C40 family peptidase [unclassified Lysinibacillus]OXS76279.1 peptidase [Lysinibacillus sp. KCTC 33748]SKB43351.1 Cell wall-associated hydrolase, NlpC family [Lysinibacillus sp. AC-3]